jgi:hypothetical protein
MLLVTSLLFCCEFQNLQNLFQNLQKVIDLTFWAWWFGFFFLSLQRI